jgi:hypothetical protein
MLTKERNPYSRFALSCGRDARAPGGSVRGAKVCCCCPTAVDRERMRDSTGNIAQIMLGLDDCIRSLPPPHAGCPRENPGSLPVLQ